MNRKRFIRTVRIVRAVVVIEVLLVLAYRGIDRDRRAAKQASFQYERVRSEPARDLLLSPNGSSRTLADLRGKPVLLHFRATWCPPCKEELRGLLELSRDLGRDACATLERRNAPTEKPR
jgi:thiol-disulfide isomerase/thioredoxin